MTSNHQYGRPLLINSIDETASAHSLTRVRFESSGAYNEAWLQRLIMQYPSLLPIEDIEPALTPAIPVCMELPVPSGSVDNLYVTPAGDIIVAETKLWRNPQAR